MSRRYGDTLALDRVSLDIAPSEILCLLGPSGCGKSTLLRIAAGVERPSSGRVLLDGQEVAGPNRFVPPEQRGVGLMFQDFALFPHLTIRDNVAFGLKSLTRREARAEAHAALERVGLAHYASEYPHILSGGEQQRVALARAIAPAPERALDGRAVLRARPAAAARRCARRRLPSCTRPAPPRSSSPMTPRRPCAWATAWR